MKTITGIPESITHAQVVTAAEALGLDPKVVRSIKIGVHHVEVVLYATTPVKILRDYVGMTGHTGFTDEAATHTVFYDLDQVEPPSDV